MTNHPTTFAKPCPESDCAVKEAGSGLTFEDLRAVNVERCNTAFFSIMRWGPMQWGCALAGEAGEACNLAKKLERDGDTEESRKEVARELADVVIYADLMASRLGFRLQDFVIEKFNEVSDRRGSPLKLPALYQLSAAAEQRVSELCAERDRLLKESATPTPSPHARGSTAEEIAAVDDAAMMRLWRECGLPEWFLGNGSTNTKLVAFAAAIRRSAEVTIAEWMFAHSYATGHGDTAADMLGELEAQAVARARTDSPVADAGDGM